MPVKNKSEKYRSYFNDGYADCLATIILRGQRSREKNLSGGLGGSTQLCSAFWPRSVTVCPASRGTPQHCFDLGFDLG